MGKIVPVRIGFKKQKMFGKDFYPTPLNVIDIMLDSIDVKDKNVLEPSAGKGNIVDILKIRQANITVCEINEDLAKIVKTKTRFLKEDFLNVVAEEISHIDFIIMNPPFSADEKHIIHAFEIAPPGCQIISLCNSETLQGYYSDQKYLKRIIEENGSSIDLEDCFSTAERKTNVKVSMVKLFKSGVKSDDFSGFFEEDDEQEKQENGIMSYNAVREIVQRYVSAVKLYDDVIENGAKMHDLIDCITDKGVTFTCTRGDRQILRNEFMKELQKQCWLWILKKVNMEKYMTKSLEADLNKFVEQQTKTPFTMKNIYQMFRVIVGTHGDRMKRVLIEVFDNITKHYDENRYNVEGWKTNSHYMLNKKFIMPYVFEKAWSGGCINYRYNSRNEVDDLTKALCYITATEYNFEMSLHHFYSHQAKRKPNVWVEDHPFFRIKGFKKGTMHAEFKDLKLWEKFNRMVAEAKGYPLPEAVRL